MRLIIAPHVDDETLGCGGILDETSYVLHMGLAENQNHGNESYSRQERLAEFSRLAGLAAISGYEVLNHPVNNYRQQDLISDIESTVNKIRPAEVYIPHPSYNQDHREVYEASLIALRPHDVNYFVPKVFIYEQPHTVLWNHNYRDFSPVYFKEIDIERKIELYLCLESQVREYRSPDCLRAMAKIRGAQANVDYAEAFEIIRFVDA